MTIHDLPEPTRVSDDGLSYIWTRGRRGVRLRCVRGTEVFPDGWDEWMTFTDGREDWPYPQWHQDREAALLAVKAILTHDLT